MPYSEIATRFALGLGTLGGLEQIVAVIHWLTALGSILGAIAYFRGRYPESKASVPGPIIVTADRIHN